MPILPSGNYLTRPECEGRVEGNRNIANAILRQAKERGIGDNQAKAKAAPFLRDAAMYEEALNQ